MPDRSSEKGCCSCRPWKDIDKEARTVSLWRDVIVELIATMFLMAAQAILPLSWGDYADFHGKLVQTAIGMGCVVTAMIEAFGPFGGAHMNPAVTLAMVISGKISFFRGLFYVPAQCLGAIAGAGLVCWITPPAFRETLAATVVHPDLGVWRAVILELWITGCLMFTILGATNEKKKTVFMPNIPIGMAVTLGVLTGSPYTGGSMNPARTLGPAVIMHIWEHHWVYWLGPCLGSSLATLIYHFCLDYKKDSSIDNNNSIKDSKEREMMLQDLSSV